MRFALQCFICLTILAPADSAGAGMPANPQLDDSFRLMYELRFDAARARLDSCRQADPEDPLCAAAEAASYLFEEFNQRGVLTSEFFLNDERLLGGIESPPDTERRRVPRRNAGAIPAFVTLKFFHFCPVCDSGLCNPPADFGGEYYQAYPGERQDDRRNQPENHFLPPGRKLR